MLIQVYLPCDGGSGEKKKTGNESLGVKSMMYSEHNIPAAT